MSESPRPSPAPDPTQVTRLLEAWNDGDASAAEALVPLVYNELHRLAHFALDREAEGHTLQTTALVHEAYVRLVGADLAWEGRRHFLSVAARAMRQVLVDYARRRRSQKRGGGQVAEDLDAVERLVPGGMAPDEGLLELDEALERLFALDERKGRAVELHYFGGLSYEEVAEALEISPATVHRDLRMARAWLQKELQE